MTDPYRTAEPPAPTPRMTMEERFERDPAFHNLVVGLQHTIEHLQLTPTEVREAAMLACIRYEERRPIRFSFDPTSREEALRLTREAIAGLEDIGRSLLEGG